MNFVWVGAGGIIGALLRYQVTKWIGERFAVAFPLATLLINVSGSLFLGLLTRQSLIWFPSAHTEAGLLLGTGICGAYTTFSTFQYELTILFREHRVPTAVIYLACSLVFGFAAAAVGLFGLPGTPTSLTAASFTG